MKLIKKLAVAGLSLLLMTSPCFAQTINAEIGDYSWILDMKVINEDFFVKASDLANYFGFEYSLDDNNSNQVFVILGDEYITLDFSLGEVQLINNHLYVPLDVIEWFDGDLGTLYNYAYDSVDPTGGYAGAKGKVSVSMSTSEEGMGVVELNLNGQTLRVEVGEDFTNNYVGYTANGVKYQFEFYQDDNTSNYKQLYTANRATYVDVYCNGKFVDCLKRTEIYYGG